MIDPWSEASIVLADLAVATKRAKFDVLQRARQSVAGEVGRVFSANDSVEDLLDSTDPETYLLGTLHELATYRDLIDRAIASFTDAAMDDFEQSARSVGDALGIADTTVTRQRSKRAANAQGAEPE